VAKKVAAEGPLSAFDKMGASFGFAKVIFDAGGNDLTGLGEVATLAVALLHAPGTSTAAQGTAILDGQTKTYECRRFGPHISRPIRNDLFIADPATFARRWTDWQHAITPGSRTLTHVDTDTILYTAAMAFAVCYDLYRPTSRKTPGTFFEVLIGAVLGEVSGLPRGKQITLPDNAYKVPTDIVLDGGNAAPTLVIPTKITTRERVVQCWAHQRILDDAFARGKYKSVLVVVSELQRDGSVGVNEICVPGQIGLYQRYLGQMYGMYYLDPPAAYQKPAFIALLPTKRFSALLENDLAELLKP
jgi:hypothetical protein